MRSTRSNLGSTPPKRFPHLFGLEAFAWGFPPGEHRLPKKKTRVSWILPGGAILAGTPTFGKAMLFVRDVYRAIGIPPPKKRSAAPAHFFVGLEAFGRGLPPGVDGLENKKIIPPVGIVDFPPGRTISAKANIRSPGGKPRLLRYTSHQWKPKYCQDSLASGTV